MRLSVETLLQVPQDTTHHAFAESPDCPEDVGRLKGPLTGDITVTRTSDGSHLLVGGELSGALERTCDRCGSTFAPPVTFRLDESLEVVHRPLTSQEVEDVVDAKGDLDVTDLVRQNLILALSGQALCGCEPLPEPKATATDDRWGPLASLSERFETSEPDTSA